MDYRISAGPPEKRLKLDEVRCSLKKAHSGESSPGVSEEGPRYTLIATTSPLPVDGRERVSPSWKEEDEDGHFSYECGENLTPRYVILGKLGEGTFGQVLECWDREEGQDVAIKVVRNLQNYREAAKTEIDVLQTLRKHDEEGLRRCVRLLASFEHRQHICMVFERLGPSLFDFLMWNQYRPFPMEMVRDFGQQLLESVAYMHQLSLIHTDLKPENILLISSDWAKVHEIKGSKYYNRMPATSDIKVIDLGSAVFDDDHHCSIVSTRHYRAPEVILGLGWSFSCDLWSIGCILIELVTGRALFQPRRNLEHLAMMERVLGPLPVSMITRADRGSEKYFRAGRELDWPRGALSRESLCAVRRLVRLPDLISASVDHSALELTDLIQGLLAFEPDERTPAKEALKHPFFREARSSRGSST